MTGYLGTHTAGGRTFTQYTWEYVCEKIHRGQERTFGTKLIGDQGKARQILGLKCGDDLICEQLQAVISKWLSIAPRTWEEFLKILGGQDKYNRFRIHIKEELSKTDIGIFYSVDTFYHLSIAIVCPINIYSTVSYCDIHTCWHYYSYCLVIQI